MITMFIFCVFFKFCTPYYFDQMSVTSLTSKYVVYILTKLTSLFNENEVLIISICMHILYSFVLFTSFSFRFFLCCLPVSVVHSAILTIIVLYFQRIQFAHYFISFLILLAGSARIFLISGEKVIFWFCMAGS